MVENLEHIGKHGLSPAQIARRKEVLNLARRCPRFAAHSAQVSRLAVSLFKQIVSVSSLKLGKFSNNQHTEWLEYAALLHDIGYIVEARRHHRHSEQLIRDANLLGFELKEIEIIALVARSHRKKWRKYEDKTFRGIGRAEYETIRVLAAMLRVADGLDRSHRHVVQGLDVARTPVALEITVLSNEAPDDEIWAAQKKGGLLAEVVGAPLTILPVTLNE